MYRIISHKKQQKYFTISGTAITEQIENCSTQVFPNNANGVWGLWLLQGLCLLLWTTIWLKPAPSKVLQTLDIKAVLELLLGNPAGAGFCRSRICKANRPNPAAFVKQIRPEPVQDFTI